MQRHYKKIFIQAAQTLANTPIVLLLLYFLPLYLVVAYYANFVGVFSCSIQGSSKCGSPLCCFVQVLSFVRCSASFNHLLCFLNNTDDDDDNDDLTHLGRQLETTTIMHISRSTESF